MEIDGEAEYFNKIRPKYIVTNVNTRETTGRLERP
jgi:hypothetical protein